MEHRQFRILYMWNTILSSVIFLMSARSNGAVTLSNAVTDYVTVIDYITEFEDIPITDEATKPPEGSANPTDITDTTSSTNTEASTSGTSTLQSTHTTSTDIPTDLANDQTTNPSEITKTEASTRTEVTTVTSFLQSIFTTSSDTQTDLTTEQPTNPSEITNTLSSLRMEVLTGTSTEQSTIKTSSGNPTDLITEQSKHPTAITESLSTGPTFLIDTSTIHSTPFSASTDHTTDAITQQTPSLTDTTLTSRKTEISSPGTARVETDSTQTPPSYTDPGTEKSKTTADTGNTESSTTMGIVTWTTKEQSTAPHTEHATTATIMLTTQRQTEPRETTMKSTTVPTGCILPADLDPDIYPSQKKDRYDVSDFILLYCPPPPYVFHGEVFSQCTEAGWSPDISGNACYAPCSSAAVPSYLTHSDESSGENKNQYDHGTTIAFTCTTSWKVLSASPSPMCVDGVWDGLDYPTCEDPVCTLPADMDTDIILNPSQVEYMLTDFIILYCPPVPYVTRGTTVSVCTEGRWEPDISDNACYAPCESVDVIGPLVFKQTSGLVRESKYTHDSILLFSCTRGILSGPSEIACADGSWDPIDQPNCMFAGTTAGITTLEPKPVFTQEYFTLPPDGENCTVYPAILDTDVYVIPQQSRLDNQFIHGDSFLLYCNDTISTPMIWFTFCWDSRWYPDPAQRFCYKTCNAPSVSSNVLHTRSDTGETSDTYYLHGNTIDYSCTIPDRSTLIGPSSSMCRDGTWDPASVPLCEVSSTTDSYLTTPLLTNVRLITSMGRTTDRTEPLGSETPNPSSWVTSVPTESATSASVKETMSTLDYVSNMTSIRRTKQTEGLTTIAPTPVQSESHQTDQPTSATAGGDVTVGTLITTVYDASTLHEETTAMTSPNIRSDTVKETQPPIFTSIQYKPTEYPTSVNVNPTIVTRITTIDPVTTAKYSSDLHSTLDMTSKPTEPDKKTTLMTSKLETSTTNPMTTETKEPGCVLPADFDPDITLSLTKGRYDVSDFIIMYCPPPPYTTVGGIFSQCTETGWLPDISDKACYAPCSAPSVPSYLTHQEQSTGDTLGEYEHGDVLMFKCTFSSKVLSHASTPLCVDGVWDDLDYPTCEDPVCTLPTDLDSDIIVNPLKDDYILDDFILLYCPPIPYATRGTAFSLCIDGRWDPSISDNACYAPCDPPAVSGPVAYTQSTGLYRSERYTHDSVLEFTCSSGLLDGPAGLACIDGSWNPDVLPTCIEPVVSETLSPASTLEPQSVFTQEPQPVFTQEYFTLPPDGQNCTTYPTILDDDIYVIPQQSRLDNQFIHGDSFLLYCNETISTPMIWFTFCWDSRWYPDPAQRFCYKTCNAPSVSSNVLHTRSDTGETSDTYYLHGNTIDYSCTIRDRSTLIGPSSSRCRDGTWDPASVPICEVSSTTNSFLTTPLLTNVPVITSMDSTADITELLRSETQNPSSGRYTSAPVTDSSSMPTTPLVITSNATPLSPKTDNSTWVTSVSTESGFDATSASVRETVSTLDYVSHMTSVRRTKLTEGLTTITPIPVLTESDQTDQPTSATAGDDVTVGTLVTTVYDASTLDKGTTAMTSQTIRSDPVTETQPPIFTSIQYKPTEYTTSLNVKKTTLLTSELETSTINPLTTEAQETSTTYSTTPFVSPAQTSTNGRTGWTESVTTQPQPSINSDAPISYSTVDHSPTTEDINKYRTSDGLTSRQVSSMPSSRTSDMISTSYLETYSTVPPVTDDTQTNPVSTEETGTDDISTKSLLTPTAATTALDSFTTPFISSESTLEQQTIEPTKSLTPQTSQSTTATANPSSAPTIGNTVDGATDRPKVTSETEAATQKTTYMLHTTEKRITKGTTKTSAEKTEQSTSAKRTTTSQQETTQGIETTSNWWVIFLGGVGAASLFLLLASCTGLIYMISKKRRKKDQKSFESSDTSASGSSDTNVTYNPGAITITDPEDPAIPHY